MKYFEDTPEKRRVRAQERLVFNATEAVCDALAERGMTRKELATRLEVSPGEVTQRLNGRRNLTLRSLADMLDALGFDLEVELRDRRAASGTHTMPPARTVQHGAGRYTTTGTQLLAVRQAS